MLTASASSVRATIAAHVLGPPASERVGVVRLHAHQRDAVGRLLRMMDEHGGALLADDVGLGKTYTALAVAARATRPLVIAPAAVREHWLESARRSGVPITIFSMEALSRHGAPSIDPDVVIIDEAHHFRSRSTRRFIAAERLCARARVLLLSATPVQNRVTDVRAVLSLFLGAAADSTGDGDLSRHVLRRTAADLGTVDARVPAVEAPEWLPRVDDSDCLDRILALPPGVPPIDGADGGALVTYTLVRQWASSRGALVAGLRRRLAHGLAMTDALSAGCVPTRGELALWCHAEDSQQLSFAQMLRADPSDGPRMLLAHVGEHVSAVRGLMHWLRRCPDPDIERARELTALLRRRKGERIVAFSEYADTIKALFPLLAGAARAAMVTHHGGRLVSGRVTRAEILARFAAGAAPRTHRRECIDLLLSTDVLSEGVNLPEAGIVVHLDLAWNPARLAQRVGRLRRVDSARERIAVFLMPPPAPAERLLQVERRLRAKRAIAMRTIGVAGTILPGTDDPPEMISPVEISELLAAILRAWRKPANVHRDAVTAAVRAPRAGAIACVRLDGHVRMFACTDGSRVTDDAETLIRLCAVADGPDAAVDEGAARRAREMLERHFLTRGVSEAVHLETMHVARSRRALLRRLSTIARRTSRDGRSRLAPLMRAARAAATTPLSAGAERLLDQLAQAPMADDVWLHAVNEFAAVHARRKRGAEREILALLLLQPD